MGQEGLAWMISGRLPKTVPGCACAILITDTGRAGQAWAGRIVRGGAGRRLWRVVPAGQVGQPAPVGLRVALVVRGVRDHWRMAGQLAAGAGKVIRLSHAGQGAEGGAARGDVAGRPEIGR